MKTNELDQALASLELLYPSDHAVQVVAREVKKLRETIALHESMKDPEDHVDEILIACVNLVYDGSEADFDRWLARLSHAYDRLQYDESEECS